ncbi:outer membrane beta-barrel protein [Chitinophaga sp. OAE865]|uniref:outer membrane beta-barrel protein n=1 Tax=Chitinophaga sp. OAE865 TaxID=2817898 RepID=UPI001AE9F8F7
MNDAFENSIRNKLNEADIPFDQDAWKKMESLLDAGNNKKRPSGWWWLLLLPVLGGLGWWIMQSPVADKTVSRATVSSPDQQSTANNRQGASTVDSSTHHLPKTTPAENKIQQQNGLLPDTPEKTNATVNKPIQQQGVLLSDNHLPKTNTAKVITGRQQTQLPEGTYLPKTNTTDRYSTEKQTTDNDNKVPGISTGTRERIDNKETVDSTAGYSVLRLLNIKSSTNYNVYTKIGKPSEIAVLTEFQQNQQEKIVRRKINSKGLYFGVTLGPDLNVAPSFNYGNVGFNIGALAHYYFNQHWFVTSGVVYSKKLYGATRSDYRNPNYTNPYDLVKVNANCDVLDIPVNINYTFLQVKNNTVSATLGMSNYIMLKEKYQYIYKYSPEKEWTVNNKNQHYLAILNVGALYQHPAGRRLIVGVQPYAKIPLHGVGSGQVKLYSAGLSLQLNLVGKKR